jgi:hypothetical protein
VLRSCPFFIAPSSSDSEPSDDKYNVFEFGGRSTVLQAERLKSTQPTTLFSVRSAHEKDRASEVVASLDLDSLFALPRACHWQPPGGVSSVSDSEQRSFRLVKVVCLNQFVRQTSSRCVDSLTGCTAWAGAAFNILGIPAVLVVVCRLKGETRSSTLPPRTFHKFP